MSRRTPFPVRHRLRATLLLPVVVLALLATLTGCGKEGDTTSSGSAGTVAEVKADVVLNGSPTFDKAKARGKLIVGVKEDQPNLGYKDPTTGQYSGFDISIANLLAARLGFDSDKIEYKAIPSANREQSIVNGDIDYYVGTYSITDKRKEQVSFAGPYYVAGQDLLVRKDDTTITGPDSLPGAKVCSVTGSTPIQNVKTKYPTAVVTEFEKYSQCVDALVNSQTDAVTTDDAILKGYAAQQPDKVKVVGKPFSTEKYGVGLAKDDKVLRDQFNDILAAAEQNGTWQQIYDATLGKSGSAGSPPPLERY